MKRFLGFLAFFTLVVLLAPAARAADAEVREAVEAIRRHAREPFEQRQRTDAIRRLGRIGGREAAAALVEVFEDPYVHLADHAVSAWIAMGKGDRANDTIAWFAKSGLRNRNPDVRRGIAVALGFARGDVAADAVAQRLAKERDPDVLVTLFRACGRMDVQRAWNLVDALHHKDGRVVLAASEALVRRGESRTIPPSVREDMLRHSDPLARAGGILACYAAGDLDGQRIRRVLDDAAVEPRIALAEALGLEREALPWESAGRDTLRALLADASWRVRAAAIETALARWRTDVVPLLLNRLALEDGRLRLDIADALSALTGKDLGTDVDLWRSWWAAKEATFDPGPRPRGPRPRRPKGSREDGAGETRAATFFRLPVLSGRVAFLLDCSGSMRDLAVEGDASGATKMAVARAELARTLERLDESVRFDVFLYRYPSEFPPRPRMTRAFGKLEAAKPVRARKALSWLARQKAKGWGAFSDALEALLAEDVDTIYFLSDGRPSRGRYDRDFRLIAELARDNRFRRVVIHTVLVGREKADREFLEDLAASTGGQFADATRTLDSR